MAFERLLLMTMMIRVGLAAERMSVSSPEDTFVNAIEGFGTDLQCYVNSCPAEGTTVKWYKDNNLIATGTSVVDGADRYSIRHNVALDHTKDCTGQCTQACEAGFHCLDNSCCPCTQEEFTLLIKNLTMADTGVYQCRLDGGNYMEFELQILEGGSFPSFGQNLTFNYTDCCARREMSAECRPMCEPRMLEAHKFDPIPCQQEISKLLQCATENGNISHVHCCRLHLVPPFCLNYCFGATSSYDRVNRLCVYWMPEIFQCYEQAYLPLPGHPENFVVETVNSTALRACWDPPGIRAETIRYYTLRYQEVPRFPFFGGSIPFLTGEGGEDEDEFDLIPLLPHDHSTADAETAGDTLRRPNLSPADGHENRGALPRKRKRQTLVITTHNFATNETEVREYRYLEINTTETCAIVEGLNAATQYTLYVLALNDYGSSLPSIKATITTDEIEYPNISLPNIRQCCEKHNVGEDCVSKMCNISQPPSTIAAFDVALTCRSEFPQVAPCLADGRDHTDCCRTKGVTGDCLKLCDGSAAYLGVSSVLCLSLDMNSIYSCLRQGYATHPSPPTNITLTRVTSTTAVIQWSRPNDNAEKVVSYSLFFKQSSSSEDAFREIGNVTTPYELVDLSSDTSYSVYLIAYTPQGKSLKSTMIQFTTTEPSVDGLCKYGQPLRDAYGDPVLCTPNLACPSLFDCVDSENDDTDANYCCPSQTVVDPNAKAVAPNITGCCSSQGVTGECLNLCTYETTADDLMTRGQECLPHIKTWIECGGDGRDDRPCCKRRGVSDECLVFCYPMLENLDLKPEHTSCIEFTSAIASCGLEGSFTLPGPPRSLRIFDRGPTYVSLLWDEPIQAVPVEMYEVSVVDGSRTISFNSTTLSLTIPDLKRDTNYVAYVRSLNDHGASIRTPNLTFTLNDAPAVEGGEAPEAPHNLEIAWYRDKEANVTWQWQNTIEGKPISNYEFNLSYVEVSTEELKSVNTKDNYVVIHDLKQNDRYNVYVTVTNLDTKRTSRPSEVILFAASTGGGQPKAELVTSPEGPFEVGQKVTVSCKATGVPTPNVTLVGNGQQLATGSGETSTVINGVSAEDANEAFLCTADNGEFVPYRATLTLKVKYAPKVNRYTETVAVMQDLPARVTCRVRGYPTPTMTWFYQPDTSKRAEERPEPTRLIASERYIMDFKEAEAEHIYNATLTVNQAESKNVGYYFCQACNDVGCANDSVKVTVEPYPVPQGPDYVVACCKQRGVRPECMSACVFDIDIKVYETNPHCVNDFHNVLSCVKDGIDHSRCCSEQNVPQQCLSYCNRRLIADDTPTNLDSCFVYTQSIVTCVEEGHKVVPGTPTNVKIQVLDQHAVNVSWDAPVRKGDNTIPMYVVYYKRGGEDQYSTVRTEETWAKVSSLETGAVYNVTVIAANHYGFSMFAPLTERRISTDTVGDSQGSRSAAGTVLAIIFCLLLAAVLVLAAVYFTRRPYKLPTFLLKLGRGGRHQNGGDPGTGSVAFENPGYNKEGQVRGLPGDNATNSLDGAAGSASSNGNGVGWENARLETPSDSPTPQRGMRYTQLS